MTSRGLLDLENLLHNIDVTLIDRDASHYACILSNLVVTGALPMSRIQFGYTNLQTKRGVKFAQGEVLSVDPVARFST